MDKSDQILHEISKLREEHQSAKLELIKEQCAVKSELATFRAAQAEICKAACAQRTDHHETLYAKPDGVVSSLQSVKDKVTIIWIGLGVIAAGLLGFGIEKFIKN